MKRSGSSIFILFILFSVFGCERTVIKPRRLSPLERLVENIEYQVVRPDFSTAKWGIYIESLKTGEIIYKHNENNLFMPASNMKLFTTGTALVKLGPDYTYRTELLTDGNISENGVLEGNLIVRGSGDPTISGRFDNGNVIATFEKWAGELKEKGISKIDGNVIGDDNLFDDEHLGSSWSWDDLPFWYAAPVGALSFNDNCIDFYVYPGDEIGDIARVEWKPQTDYFTLENTVTTSQVGNRKNVRFWRKLGTNEISVEGDIPINASRYSESISVHNPTLYFITVLYEVLKDNGIEITGTPVDIDDIPETDDDTITEYVVLAEQVSPELSSIIKVVNKNSQNFYAEQLLRTLGCEFGELGSAREGIMVVEGLLKGIGVNTNEFFMQDGSGLSHQNLVKPANVAALLKYLYNHRNFQYFYDSLPVAGVNGTIKVRMKNTAAENNVHAKTGYIGHVRSLSGYVTSQDNEPFVFSMIVNHFSVPRSVTEDLQDRVCVMLANFSRK